MYARKVQCTIQQESFQQGRVKMQASILSLVFKLAELIFIKAINSINQ
jgi:hypothetical protein